MPLGVECHRKASAPLLAMVCQHVCMQQVTKSLSNAVAAWPAGSTAHLWAPAEPPRSLQCHLLLDAGAPPCICYSHTTHQLHDSRRRLDLVLRLSWQQLGGLSDGSSEGQCPTCLLSHGTTTHLSISYHYTRRHSLAEAGTSMMPWRRAPVTYWCLHQPITPVV